MKLGSKILNKIGIKTKTTKDSIKIYGNPKISLHKRIKIKNFMKDHRIFMFSCVAALTLNGNWLIEDTESINTSFPKFLNILKSLGANIN